MLICLEGIDGSGKSTQINKLAHYLSINHKVTISSWNSNKYVNNILKKLNYTEFSDPLICSSLIASEFASRYEKEIIPALEKNEIVLCDRYILTPLTRDSVRGTPIELLELFYSYAKEPDITIFLKTDREIIYNRLVDRGNGIVNYWESGLDSFMDIPIKESYYLYENNMIPQELITESTYWFIDSINEKYQKYLSRPNVHIIENGISSPESTFEKIIELLRKEGIN